MRIVAASGYAVCLGDRDVSDSETRGKALHCRRIWMFGIEVHDKDALGEDGVGQWRIVCIMEMDDGMSEDGEGWCVWLSGEGGMRKKEEMGQRDSFRWTDRKSVV